MKIHVFGASGSGVTTLGRKLAETLSLPYFDSDEYFWEHTVPEFTIERNPALRNEMLTQDLQKQDDWILGGSMYAWGCTPDFDLVVFLWIPQEIRIERLKAREFKRYGESIFREGERKKLYIEFIEWAKGYDSGSISASSRTLAAHEHWMANLPCAVLEIRGDCTIEKKLMLVSDNINSLGISKNLKHQNPSFIPTSLYIRLY